MADHKEIDDILKEVKARKEKLDKKENPFSEVGKPETDNEDVTIDISENEEAKAPEEEAPAEVAEIPAEEPAPEEAPQAEAEASAPEEPEAPAEDVPAEEAPLTEEVIQNPPTDELIPPIPQEEFEIIDDSEETDVNYEAQLNEEEQAAKKKKIMVIVAVCVVAAIAIAGVLYAVLGKDKEPETTAPPTTVTTTETTTAAPVLDINPLTGENDYNKDAIGKRPVACVVENSQPARPQWGIDDETNPPDIILQGEVEGGETRMLWFFADYTNMPENIGPTRSARPPYIRFSEMFDAIFIHWGMSSTTDDYYGADSVFIDDDVDHINEMQYGDGSLFGRYNPRGVSLEHTGCIYGENVASAIEGEGFRTDVDKASFSQFNFNSEIQKLSDTPCTYLSLRYSSRTHTTDWTYQEDGMYHTPDFNNDVKRENLLVLMDETEYITKSNYKGSGSNEVYCNYRFAGGTGKLASNGTVIDVTWAREDGLLVVKDSAGKPVSLNPGKTWIGWGSSNNGGSVEITG